MDHLHNPADFQGSALLVPYLNIAPPFEKEDNLLTYPERCGHDVASIGKIFNSRGREGIQTDDDEQMDDEQTNKFVEYLNSFYQEWLWFGLLYELEKACQCTIGDIRAYYVRVDNSETTVLDTSLLLVYIRHVIMYNLTSVGVPLDLKKGDVVNLRDCRVDSSQSRARSYQVVEDLGNLEYRLKRISAQSWWDGFNCFITKSAEHLERASGNERHGTPFNYDDLTTIPLQVFRQMYKSRLLVGTAQETARAHNFGALATCVEMAQTITRTMRSQDSPIIRFEIVFSIDILCETLRQIMKDLAPAVECSMNPSTLSSDFFYSEYFRQKMEGANWCEARAQALQVDILAETYVKSLFASHEHLSHAHCRKPLEELTICSLRPQQVDMIKPRHSGTCGGSCRMITFPEIEIINILKAGGNAGVSETTIGRGDALYTLVDIRTQAYVAISHVWSHGLGNPAENALPTCQVKLLFQQIKAISPGNPVLWIDILSVPIDTEYKTVAIRRLRNVYRNANKVLVVDKHLCCVGSDWLERRFQVLSSEWMRRLWTLQEGRLASNLFIQFKDDAAPIASLCTEELPLDAQYDCDIFTGLYKLSGHDLGICFSKSRDIKRRFLDLLLDMRRRSTTVKSDEPICLATMLDLSLEKLGLHSTMEDVYRSLPEIPADIIFTPSPRLTTLGFRWAPTTFLEQERFARVEDDIRSASLVKGGLRVCKDCIRLPAELPFQPVSYYFLTSKETCTTTITDYDFIVNGVSTSLVSQSLQNAAVILQKCGSLFKNTSNGIVVSDVRIIKGVWHCHFEFHVAVRRVNEHHHNWIQTLFVGPVRNKTFMDWGEFKPNVEFCID